MFLEIAQLDMIFWKLEDSEHSPGFGQELISPVLALMEKP